MQINKDIITWPNGFSLSQNYELSKSKDDNDEKLPQTLNAIVVPGA